jgi:ATP-dependent RNA helicase HrpA
MRRNIAAVEEVRDVWRRSGGQTPRLGLDELTKLYEGQLHDVKSITDLRHAALVVDPDAFVSRDERAKYLALPGSVSIRDRDVEIRYEVEDTPEGPRGVARLRLPEKMARTLSEEEVPTLDRPVRFAVSRGQRGTAKADTLETLQEELERPFSADELAQLDRAWDDRQAARRARKQQRRARDASRELRGNAQGRGRDEGRDRGGQGRQRDRDRGRRRRR